MFITSRHLTTAAALGAALVIAGCASSGHSDKPAKPAPVTAPTDANADPTATYASLIGKMQKRYTKSGDPVAAQYTTWQVFNKAPYQSSTHGKRMVNNYANDIAAATYGQFPNITAMPVGSILAKDSYKVNNKGKAVPGPLFLMEKMPAGFNEKTRDWKYWAILPNGKNMGTTNGENAKKVAFCSACHNGMGNATDAVTFLPEEHRK